MRPRLTLVAAWAFAVSCSGGTAGFPQVEGWDQVGDVRVYTAENLWEYIDGAAELFVEYGIQTCTAADLTAAGVAVTVNLYQMASPLGAVGVFKTESSGKTVKLNGATLAAISPPFQALFVKGATYAKVNAYEGELTESEGRQLLSGLSASLPGDSIVPREFSLLPKDGMVMGSERYQPVSLLGLEELTDCVYADYEGRDRERWLGFVVLPSSAATVWGRLDDQWESFEHRGRTVLFRDVPYSGLVGVTRTASGMFGVAGANTETELRERLGAFAGLR